MGESETGKGGSPFSARREAESLKKELFQSIQEVCHGEKVCNGRR
jgi:hypothetical protein